MTRRGAVLAAIALPGLLTAAGLHVAWGAGSAFPASSRELLAEAVVGHVPGGGLPSGVPGSAACYAVAGALTAASGLVVVRARQKPGATRSSLPALGCRVAGSVLLVRGVGGFAAAAFHIPYGGSMFRRWNLRVYSPVCVVLGSALVVLGSD